LAAKLRRLNKAANVHRSEPSNRRKPAIRVRPGNVIREEGLMDRGPIGLKRENRLGRGSMSRTVMIRNRKEKGRNWQ
jgi:hypothetical protein